MISKQKGRGERQENEWLVEKTSESYPLRPFPLLCQLENICTGCSHFVAGETESPLSLCSQPTSAGRPPPSVCPRGANYDSPLSICQRGYFVRRGGPLLLSKPSRKLLFADSSSPRGHLYLAIPHASSIHARSSLGQTPTDLLPLPTCTFFLSFFSRPNLRICPELFPLEFLFSFLFSRLNFLFLLPFHRIKPTFRGSGGAIRKRRDESFYI